MAPPARGPRAKKPNRARTGLEDLSPATLEAIGADLKLVLGVDARGLAGLLSVMDWATSRRPSKTRRQASCRLHAQRGRRPLRLAQRGQNFARAAAFTARLTAAALLRQAG